MITYIFKMLFCSCVLLIVYQLLLSKEKMYHFNRFYLLFSLAFSLIMPTIEIAIEKQSIPVQENIQETVANISFQTQNIIPYTSENTLKSVTTTLPILANFAPTIGLSFYCIITGFLLLLFIVSILALLNNKKYTLIKKNKQVTLVLTAKPHTPYSFFGFIFLPQKDYENGAIEQEILQHEMAHVNQKHSIDIVLVELLLVFFWFNPFLYLYKKAIALNHEFLADDQVINTSKNISQYQLLLLNKAHTQKSISLSSPFNYLTIKKRLIMMSKNKQSNLELAKQLSLIPLVLILSAVVCTKIFAQQVKEIVKQDSIKTTLHNNTIGVYRKIDKQKTKFAWGLSIGSTIPGVSAEMLKEYDDILVAGNLKDAIIWRNKTVRIEATDRSKLEAIFKQMNEDQQDEQIVGFYKPRPPSKNKPPTTTQFNNFKNPKLYGIWINDKKVANSVLEKYKAEDFSDFYASKLYGAAKKNVSYAVQVDLMTNNFYKDYYNKRVEEAKKTKLYFKQKKIDKGSKPLTYYIVYGVE